MKRVDKGRDQRCGSLIFTANRRRARKPQVFYLLKIRTTLCVASSRSFSSLRETIRETAVTVFNFYGEPINHGL
jgi:hypothetical protein